MTYQLLTLSGDPIADDIVEVSLSDSNGNTKEVSYTVVAGNNISVIVSNLCDLITDTNFIPVIYNEDSFYVYSPNDYTVAGTLNITTTTREIDSYMWSFNETRNAYCCFYDEIPECIMCAQDVTFMWRNGECYIQNNTTDYGKFFGVQTYPNVTLVFNDKVQLKKTFEALAYQANQYWIAENVGDIVTSQPNAQTELPQISQLIEQDFEINEGLYYAAFLRDANSMEDARLALVDGDFLKGISCQIKLTYKGSEFAFLYLPYLNWQPSQRNF